MLQKEALVNRAVLLDRTGYGTWKAEVGTEIIKQIEQSLVGPLPDDLERRIAGESFRGLIAVQNLPLRIDKVDCSLHLIEGPLVELNVQRRLTVVRRSRRKESRRMVG